MGKEWSLLGVLLMPWTDRKQHGRRYENSSRPNTKDRQHGRDCKDRKSGPTGLKRESLPISEDGGGCRAGFVPSQEFLQEAEKG